MSVRADAAAEASDADLPPGRPLAPTGRSASAMVAAGILLSRVFGLVRERVFAHYFGATLFADAFRAGLRIPNLIQNLLGEGTLSASFIPVYAELLERGETEKAGRVAGAVFALLVAIAGALALLGVLFAPLVVKVLLPGFDPVREALTIRTVRILFPMTALFVLSAWSLGILNSHRHFFISYVSPVVWNAAMIAAMYLFGGRMGMERLLLALCWGALVGGALQFAMQLPWVWRLERGLKVRWDMRLAEVREVVRNATPAMLGRGVVQFSAYVDFMLASLLAAGGVATIGYALTLYMLPISLFGMSVAAAEFPELARQRASGTELLRERTNAGLERIAFYVMPSFVAFMLLGDIIVAALFQTGRFGANDTRLVYLTLAGFSVSLLATTGSRLFSSTYFALRDTRTPARFAALRVLNSAVFGFLLMLLFEPVTSLRPPARAVGARPPARRGVAFRRGRPCARCGDRRLDRMVEPAPVASPTHRPRGRRRRAARADVRGRARGGGGGVGDPAPAAATPSDPHRGACLRRLWRDLSGGGGTARAPRGTRPRTPARARPKAPEVTERMESAGYHFECERVPKW